MGRDLVRGKIKDVTFLIGVGRLKMSTHHSDELGRKLLLVDPGQNGRVPFVAQNK